MTKLAGQAYNYRSMVYAKANICISESSESIWNSNETLLKTNESKMRTYGLHFRLIIIEPIYSGAHFNDKYIAFGVVVCIKAPAPIFRMNRVCETSCWNHISGYHKVLKPYTFPDSKVHSRGQHGPTWVLSAQGGPHKPCYLGWHSNNFHHYTMRPSFLERSF